LGFENSELKKNCYPAVALLHKAGFTYEFKPVPENLK